MNFRIINESDKSVIDALEKLNTTLSSLNLNSISEEQGEWNPEVKAGENVLNSWALPSPFLKIGRMVYFSTDITIQPLETNNDIVEINGLPYLSIDRHWQGGNVSFVRNFNLGASPMITMLTKPLSQTIQLYYHNENSGSSAIRNNNFNPDSRIILSGCYLISHPIN